MYNQHAIYNVNDPRDMVKWWQRCAEGAWLIGEIIKLAERLSTRLPERTRLRVATLVNRLKDQIAILKVCGGGCFGPRPHRVVPLPGPRHAIRRDGARAGGAAPRRHRFAQDACG